MSNPNQPPRAPGAPYGNPPNVPGTPVMPQRSATAGSTQQQAGTARTAANSATASSASQYSSSATSNVTSSTSATTMSNQTVRQSSSFTSQSMTQTSTSETVRRFCSNTKIQGSVFYAECQVDATTTITQSIDLNLYLGNVNGTLTWGFKDFAKKSTNITLQPDGFTLAADCEYSVSGRKGIRNSTINLLETLRYENNNLFIIIPDPNISKMFTEVPWMKFQVVAVPDLELFTAQSFVKESMVKVAESTVEYVTREMKQRVEKAIEVAITEITAATISRVMAQMQAVIRESVSSGAAANLGPSGTNRDNLHLFAESEFSFSSEGIKVSA